MYLSNMFVCVCVYFLINPRLLSPGPVLSRNQAEVRVGPTLAGQSREPTFFSLNLENTGAGERGDKVVSYLSEEKKPELSGGRKHQRGERGISSLSIRTQKGRNSKGQDPRVWTHGLTTHSSQSWAQQSLLGAVVSPEQTWDMDALCVLGTIRGHFFDPFS